MMGNSTEICRRHYAVLIAETNVDYVEFVQIDNRTKQVSADTKKRGSPLYTCHFYGVLYYTKLA
jgi:hypothetical protein